jgi:long-chain acyl-CoA synthetase
MIQDLLLRIAASDPSQVAMVAGDRVLLYSDLERMARGAGSYFMKEGLHRGDKVIVLWENAPEYAALFFGILMAGGVVVPLNPSNYQENVRRIAGHCSAKFIVAASQALQHVSGWWKGGVVVTNSPGVGGTVDVASILFGDSVDHVPVGESRPGDLALILYTSGTTGKPKGVMLTHSNLEANTRSILATLPIISGTKTLAVLPFYYSYGNSLLLTHVAAGGTLVVENQFAFVNKALATMRRHAVNGFSGVPSHFAILINRSNFLQQGFPDLQYMTCAGGGLPLPHIKVLRNMMPHVKLHLMYGQTEGAARLSALDSSLVDVKVGSVGKGIPGVELRVVDKGGEDVPSDTIGELIARGSNIMVGYLNDPEGTREVVRNGWLRTGDLASVDDEGYIFIRGRASEFIKCGGYRIGPQEVEGFILQHPSVLECAVVGAPDEILGERIVAIVVFRDTHSGPEAEETLLGHLRGGLPHYMVPKTVIRIDIIPKTDTGKTRRLELRDKIRTSTASMKNAEKDHRGSSTPFPQKGSTKG